MKKILHYLIAVNVWPTTSSQFLIFCAHSEFEFDTPGFGGRKRMTKVEQANTLQPFLAEVGG